MTRTQAEGPGVRAAVWVQGCSIRCPGCFNAGTWGSNGGVVVSVNDLVEELFVDPDIEGVTFLGGEPFEQAAGLAVLARVARSRGLSVMTFTGNEYAALRVASRPDVAALLDATDLLVDGPYRAEAPDNVRPWVGSTNQQFRFLTDRYSNLADKLPLIPDRLEVKVARDGRVELNGMASMEQLERLLAGLGRVLPGGALQYSAATDEPGAVMSVEVV